MQFKEAYFKIRGTEMDNLISFIPEQLLILVAVLFIIGKECKKYK
ncbi:putative holin protein [Clostridioides difficile CD160]|nr:putative holin protein [Clostridioides difficile CD160]